MLFVLIIKKYYNNDNFLSKMYILYFLICTQIYFKLILNE